MRQLIIPVRTEPHVVVEGSPHCDHIGSQVIKYDSPKASHTVWSCPNCHRVVRHDVPPPFPQAGKWTEPRVQIPEGNEGVPTPKGRAWKMPDAVPLSKKRWRWL